MSENPLKIVASDNQKASVARNTVKTSRTEAQARLERMWLTSPLQFDPHRNCMERERLARLKELINSFSLKKGNAVDLGCAYGDISRALQTAGWQVTAIDIANNALNAMRAKGAEGITLKQDALPCTKLDDDAFELVVCTDVIGYLEEKDYRLLMAELSRLVTSSGNVITSTGIDIYSEDALQRFGALAETEFQIDQWHFSYHRLWLSVLHFFEIPKNLVEGAKDAAFRKQELGKRTGISRWWYNLNTSFAASLLWVPLKWLATPFVGLLKQNNTLLIGMEKVCKLFWSNSGISHATFIGHRRPLIMPTQADIESREIKGKKQVWE